MIANTPYKKTLAQSVRTGRGVEAILVEFAKTSHANKI